MIEAKGTRIYSDGKLLCTVELVGEIYESGPHAGFVRPDYDASNKRAEHIAQALRHYQQSQEGKANGLY